MRRRCRALAFAWLAVCVCLIGCLEMIRRPDPVGRLPAGPGPGKPTAAGPDTAAIQPAGPAIPSSRPERDSQHRRDIEAVNEYVYWCIGQGMWNEAQLHLEKALQQDSLSSSLHNNLGIVYERLGDSARAAAAYQKARSLNPGNRAYKLNLEQLEKRYRAESGETPQARIDSAVTRELVPAAEADSASSTPHLEE